MKASELAQGLADSVGIKRQQAADLLRNLGVAVSTTLKDGGETVLPGIGKLKPDARAARTARNPSTGATIAVPAKTVVKFKVAKELADAVA